MIEAPPDLIETIAKMLCDKAGFKEAAWPNYEEQAEFAYTVCEKHFAVKLDDAALLAAGRRVCNQINYPLAQTARDAEFEACRAFYIDVAKAAFNMRDGRKITMLNYRTLHSSSHLR